jgi:hypothetical protein
MKKFIKHIANTILAGIIFYVEKYRFLYAMRKANRLHFLNGKRYWVIKLQGKYRVFSGADIKALKARGIFRKDVDFIKLQSIAIYNTDEKNKRKWHS